MEKIKPGNTNPGNANLPIGEKETTHENSFSANLQNAIHENGAPITAAQESGVPSGDPNEPRWHSRGYLPHFEAPQAIQHVTFHLADSLPKHVLEQLEEELIILPEDKQDMERRKRIEAWIDAGHGSCILHEPAIARMVQNSLMHFDAQRYHLLAWVVMPNHVHVLFQPMKGYTMAGIVASWKKFTARKINDYKKAKVATQESGDPRKSKPGNANLQIGEKNAAQESGDPSKTVWHREYWDRYIRNELHFHKAIEYIHQNPVKAGLASSAQSWRWSSANTGNIRNATQESGDPRSDPGNAAQEIGAPSNIPRKSKPGNANLQIGEKNAAQESGVSSGDPRSSREKL